MHVELLVAGHLTAPLGLLRRGEDLAVPLRFPVPVFLLEDGDERILVDCGPHPAAVADAEAHYGTSLAPFSAEPGPALDELVDLSTITRVVLTHLHFDHAGALALVPAGVPVVVQRREWEAAHDADAVARNHYRPRDYAGREVVLVDGDHDLLGDGRVELLLTPGHTPGHQSVRVGDLVIGGDVSHLAAGLDDGRFPLFADDHAAQATSARRLAALREEGCTVLPGHDPQVLLAGTLRSGA